MSGPIRSFALVIVALAIATLLLHRQISSALVARGDALAYVGSAAHAGALYARAVWFDRDNGVAVDRLAFRAVLSSDRNDLDTALAVSDAYLDRHPADVAVRMDRALCFQREHAFARAEADFIAVGRRTRDPRALMFAALDARALHHPALARSLLALAVRVDATFLPARRALARVGG